MRPEDLLQHLRRQPFQPFRIHMTGGEVYDIRHPDQAIVMRSRVVVGAGAKNGVPDHLEHLALVHIVRVEEQPPTTNGGV